MNFEPGYIEKAVFVDFSQTSEKVINFSHVFEPGEIDLNDADNRVAGKLEVSGTAHKTEAGADVAGKISGKLEIACDRCLKPLESDVVIEFEDDFVTLTDYEKSTAENHEIAGADLDVSIYDGERIDISELVREQILLNLPARQLCDENCTGLCETCGADKNTENCSCESETIDPRWNALKQLKNQK
ncbi:MAG: DUF177 domain-containing protein [Acidobacteriota bacterium]|nr:DUF177 domain-containing protein [Acidobacteriota bacterium]